MYDLPIPHEYPHDIDSEIAIALQESRSREGEEDSAEEQDRIEGFITDISLIQEFDSEPSHRISQQSPYGELQEEGHEDAPHRAILIPTRDILNEGYREHVGHRVITPTL